VIDRVIVSRHKAAVEFIAAALAAQNQSDFVVTPEGVELGWYQDADSGAVMAPGAGANAGYDWSPTGRIPVVADDALPDDVRDRIVYGNLPLHLAALAAEVWAVEFDGPPPRGAEYTAEDMRRAGARLTRYTVRAVEV
jgi:hypothetical protein